MDDIATLQKIIEEQRRALEEAERRAANEQRRREDAEERASSSQPLTLEPYLEACHALSRGIEVITDPVFTTKGETTNPAGRQYPRRIVPWTDFPRAQEEIWEQLSEPSFVSQAIFPSHANLGFARTFIGPITSEDGLRNFALHTVESAVRTLVDAAHGNPLLRGRLGLRGTVTFDSHTNLGPGSGNNSSLSAKGKNRGKGNRADQFCVYRTSDGANTPSTAIEYKAPHKLARDELVEGLASEIQPARDIINIDGEGPAFASKALAAAVVTQLFSYMVGRALRYGYICTGEVFVFLRIPEDDPAVVFYHVCVPNLDVLDDDDNRLHRTAVAQVFAFVLQALRAAPPAQSWLDAAADLDTWAVEYEDVLRKIPATVRKEPYASPYKPQRWAGFRRSPIRTRSRCKPLAAVTYKPRDDDDGGDGSGDEDRPGPPSSPTPDRSAQSARGAAAAAAAATSATSSGRTQTQRGKRGGGQKEAGQARPAAAAAAAAAAAPPSAPSPDRSPPQDVSRAGKQTTIQDAPYCTQQCLLGLATSGPVDRTCPNAPSHGPRHIDRRDFLRLVRAQLARDRGPDADAAPLYIAGSVGALFKVRLTAHGYTLVAKGVETDHLARLQHEARIYSRVQSMQGRYVPVCLGLVDLVLPYYYDFGKYRHFLFLGWAGRSLNHCAAKTMDRAVAVDAITAAYAELHRLRVVHRDAEPRNVLYDAARQTFMVTDFERSEVHEDRQPLGSISRNGRKRKRGEPKKQEGGDVFAGELRSAMASVIRCLNFMKP